jgi:cell division protein FtsQ
MSATITAMADHAGEGVPRGEGLGARLAGAVANVTRRRVWRAAGALTALSFTAASPLWGPSALAGLSYFNIRRVEVVGARYLSARDVYALLAVDTGSSVWQRTSRLERRVASHPQVRSARVERKLPGTLVVRVVENAPVALAPARDGLRPVDAAGRALPIDPSRVDLDLPVVARADPVVLRVLDDVRQREPALYARISEARRGARDELVLVVPPLLVRATPDLTARRLADILPVEADLARRRTRAAELDLRFRDQVLARLQ